MISSGQKRKRKEVQFAPVLETVYLIETYFGNSKSAESNAAQASSVAPTSQLTEEIQVLSTEHGRARRHLREIPKFCLQAAVKHGTKTPACLNLQCTYKYTNKDGELMAGINHPCREFRKRNVYQVRTIASN